MSANKKEVMLIVGSPRKERSTSHSLGNYLVQKLGKQGWVSRTIYSHDIYNDENLLNKMFQEIDKSDLIILAAPLYIDSIPAPVIKVLQEINNYRRKVRNASQPDFLIIINCGFPEAEQNNTAIKMYKEFSDSAGFKWLGGLSMGMGGAVNGKPLLKAGGMVRNIRKALDLTAASIVVGESIPEEAFTLMSKKLIPKWLYLFIGNSSWKRQAKMYGAKDKLYDRPYIVSYRKQ